jgi:hypothetical protein
MAVFPHLLEGDRAQIERSPVGCLPNAAQAG